MPPAGRPHCSKRARDDDDGGDASDGDGDDDDESVEFSQYYRVSPAQKSFNEDAAHGYLKHEHRRSEITIYPDNLFASGCKQSLIGLVPVHI